LYGQSWGGLLAIEYGLKHQDNLKGLIISNMMSDIPAYNEIREKRFVSANGPEGSEGDSRPRCPPGNTRAHATNH
jgi:proline iminopeptidase